MNDAFENLPAGTVETLLKPENKAQLSKVLTYQGTASLKTVSGGTLKAMMNGPKNVVLTRYTPPTPLFRAPLAAWSGGMRISLPPSLFPFNRVFGSVQSP